MLRFTARRLTHAAFWWDDWLMLPAIVSTTFFSCILDKEKVLSFRGQTYLWMTRRLIVVQLASALMCLVSLTYSKSIPRY